jgi:hypothetical protein
MDLELNTNLEKIKEILKEVGFHEVKINEKGILEAKMKNGLGRIHILGLQINKNKTYLDVHRDALIHFLFIGVDYKNKPSKICEKVIECASKKGIEGIISGGTNWLNRKNKALLRGINIEKP